MNNEYVSDDTVVEALTEVLFCDKDQAQKVERLLFDNRIELIEFEDAFWLKNVYTDLSTINDDVRQGFIEYVVPGEVHRAPDGLSLYDFLDWDKIDKWAFYDVTIFGDGDIFVALDEKWFEYTD